MRWLLNHVDSTLLGLLVIGITTVGTWLGLKIARSRQRSAEEDSELASALLGVIGAIYGIVLAFVIVTLWETFDSARDTVQNEASSLAQMTQDIKVLDPADEAPIRLGIAKYIDAVVNDEWRQMEVGRRSSDASRALDSISIELEKTTPSSDVQRIWYEQAVTKYNDVVGFRRERIEIIRDEMPNVFRVLIFGGAIVPIWFMVTLAARRRRVHAFMVITVAALIGYSVFLVLVLEYPFSGTVHISSHPFREGALASLPDVP